MEIEKCEKLLSNSIIESNNRLIVLGEKLSNKYPNATFEIEKDRWENEDQLRVSSGKREVHIDIDDSYYDPKFDLTFYFVNDNDAKTYQRSGITDSEEKAVFLVGDFLERVQ